MGVCPIASSKFYKQRRKIQDTDNKTVGRKRRITVQFHNAKALKNSKARLLLKVIIPKVHRNVSRMPSRTPCGAHTQERYASAVSANHVIAISRKTALIWALSHSLSRKISIVDLTKVTISFSTQGIGQCRRNYTVVVILEKCVET